MKKYAVLTVMAALLLGACEQKVGDKYEWAHSDSFVVQYWTFDTLEASCIASDNNRLNLYLRNSPGHTNVQYGVLSEDAQLQQRYKDKCTEHGDRGFPFEFLYGPDLMPNSFPDKDFTEIEVVSDADFDERHPAGSRLDDLMLFCSASPWRFISSGYSEQADWSDKDIPAVMRHYYGIVEPYDTKNSRYYHPVYGKASEMGADDLTLLGGDDGGSGRMGLIGVLTFMKEPDSAGEHTITVTMVTSDGERYSGSTLVTFD